MKTSAFLISPFINAIMECHVITLETHTWNFERMAIQCPRAWAVHIGKSGNCISSVIKRTPDPNDFPVCKLNNNMKTKSTGSNRKAQI